MAGTRLAICDLLLAALAVPGVWAIAGDDDDTPRRDDRRAVRVERDDDRDDERPKDDDRRRDSDRRRDRDRPRDGDRLTNYVATLPSKKHSARAFICAIGRLACHRCNGSDDQSKC